MITEFRESCQETRGDPRHFLRTVELADDQYIAARPQFLNAASGIRRQWVRLEITGRVSRSGSRARSTSKREIL